MWCRQCHRDDLSTSNGFFHRPGVASDENTNRSESRTVFSQLQFQETTVDVLLQTMFFSTVRKFHTCFFWQLKFFSLGLFVRSYLGSIVGNFDNSTWILWVFSCVNSCTKAAPEVSGPVPRRWRTQSPAGEASEPTTVRLDTIAIVASS